MAEAIWSLLYLGYLPRLPGTAGSLGGLLIYLGLMRLPLSGMTVPAAAAVLLAGAVWGGFRAQRHYDQIDPLPCVIDEGCGILVALIGIATFPLWHGAVLGFALFRLFDVTKPFPIRRVEKLTGGWGIALDDVLAGIYANISCRVLLAVISAALH